MILIDKTRISEKVTADGTFVCCFLHDDSSYMCFVHLVKPEKKLYQIIITNSNEMLVENKKIEKYDLYWHALNTICRRKNPNSKELRELTDSLIPVDWKLVDSAQFVNEYFNSCIRKFLLEIFKGSTCDIVSNPEELSEIDGNAEIID